MRHLSKVVLACALLLPANAFAGEVLSSGKASWYKCCSRTANGERFNPDGLTAAHRSLPFGTKVRVENVRTGQAVVVRINDRGPFSKNRIIDLSRGAANRIGLINSGVSTVRLKIVK
ncbi:septal ring lytic transglycosylase RlpA family protein [Mesorhizobium sp. SP-1A]|uniref:septal ring lytic transglycosylase RlpA family protein n=1 Tax=Mesorhizobium sp. SP-1A TaxID=3077840 RepID=UPI0028F6EDC5|nr:septal ring lytic transglycosylase RlpA family protein [Mesorhizobium sp. SP-1A]